MTTRNELRERFAAIHDRLEAEFQSRTSNGDSSVAIMGAITDLPEGLVKTIFDIYEEAADGIACEGPKDLLGVGAGTIFKTLVAVCSSPKLDELIEKHGEAEVVRALQAFSVLLVGVDSGCCAQFAHMNEVAMKRMQALGLIPTLAPEVERAGGKMTFDQSHAVVFDDQGARMQMPIENARRIATDGMGVGDLNG